MDFLSEPLKADIWCRGILEYLADVVHDVPFTGSVLLLPCPILDNGKSVRLEVNEPLLHLGEFLPLQVLPGLSLLHEGTTQPACFRRWKLYPTLKLLHR